ncbi:hypothetical protein BKA56DRAFT_228130 [Ilyonectria sp. MPI-CAGE-AT-0026]|nr:hypothetical protein BKA56DRAFT_228130 [Ilyonectria sp. MPI-CAGE-AT-0026]
MKIFKRSKRHGGCTDISTLARLAPESEPQPSSGHRVKKSFQALAVRLRSAPACHAPLHHCSDVGDQYHSTNPGSPRAILKHQLSTPRLTPKLAPIELPTNSGLLATHKGSARKSCLNESEIAAALRLYITLLAGGTTGQDAQGQSHSSHSGQGSSSKAGQSQSRLLGSWSNKEKGKGRDRGRKRSGDEQPGGEGSKKQKPDQPNLKGQLACPFYIRYRKTYAACRTCKFRAVADVRRHILRSPAHRQPLHCPLCKLIFVGHSAEVRSQRDKHVRQCHCTGNDDEVPGITEDQIQQLKDPENRSGSMAENWFELWEILFPGVGRPSAPYLSASEYQDYFEDVIKRFWEFGPGQYIPAEDRPAMYRAYELLMDYLPVCETSWTAAAAAPPSCAPDSPVPSPIDLDLPATATQEAETIAAGALVPPFGVIPEGLYAWHADPVYEASVEEVGLNRGSFEERAFPTNDFSNRFSEEYPTGVFFNPHLPYGYPTQGDLAQEYEYPTQQHSGPECPSPLDPTQIDPSQGYPPQVFTLRSPSHEVRRTSVASTPPPAPGRQDKHHQSDDIK